MFHGFERKKHHQNIRFKEKDDPDFLIVGSRIIEYMQSQ